MSIFEEVKAKLNIRQVIESFGVKVNRRGQFVCPFHNDHRPSASIKDDYYHCFVCNSGGDLITFTAKYLGLSNLDAAKELIRIFNLNIDISTPEERKAQYMAEKKRREEVKKQVSLRGKFAKDKEIRAERRAFTDYKMRADRTQAAKKKEQEQEDYLHHVALVLADMHCYLWQGIHLYPISDERHIKGLQELATCEYYLDEYDRNPIEFVQKGKGVIKKYERELQSYKDRE